MNNKYIKSLTLVIAFLILTITTIASYAYFSASVNGNNDAYNTVITTGTMQLLLTDGEQITLDNAIPRSSLTKTFKVKNTGTVATNYSIYFTDLINTFTDKNDLVYTLTSPTGCQNSNEKLVPSETGEEAIIVSSCQINSNQEHEYTLNITFKEDNTNQDDNKGKIFSAKISVNKYDYISNLVTGQTFNEQIKKLVDSNNTYESEVSEIKSFQRSLNAPTEDTDYINVADSSSNKPFLVWFDNDEILYYYTEADKIYFNSDSSYSFSNLVGLTSLDLSDFNTSKVTNMSYMFNRNLNIASLNLGNNFDTSNVINMEGLFYGLKALQSLDLKDKFNTSNVTNMSFMFSSMNSCTSLNLGNNFDTSNVTEMSYMFNGLNSFTKDSILELGDKFDTSNVKMMNGMFSYYGGSAINFGYKFNTSKVENMFKMFSFNWNMETLDISFMDTSNVINMENMFANTLIKTIFVSDKFVITKVNASGNMFLDDIKLVGGAGTTYDANHINRDYAHVDGGSSNPGYFTLKTS